MRGIPPFPPLFLWFWSPNPKQVSPSLPIPDVWPSSPFHWKNRPLTVLTAYRALSSNSLSSWNQGLTLYLVGVKRALGSRDKQLARPLSPWAAEASAGCFTFQFLLIIVSGSAFKSFIIFYSTFVNVCWQKVFKIVIPNFFVPFYWSSCIFSMLCFQIYMYSQLSAVFAISSKCFQSSNVMAEEMHARKYLYPALAGPQKLYKDHELWWVEMMTWLKQKFTLKCCKSKLIKGDVDCYFLAEV